MNKKAKGPRKSTRVVNQLISEQDAHEHHPLVTQMMFTVLQPHGLLGIVANPAEMTLIHNIMHPDNQIEVPEEYEINVAQLIGRMAFAMNIQQRVIHALAAEMDGQTKTLKENKS